jgi:hypothetical protein
MTSPLQRLSNKVTAPAQRHLRMRMPLPLLRPLPNLPCAFSAMVLTTYTTAQILLAVWLRLLVEVQTVLNVFVCLSPLGNMYSLPTSLLDCTMNEGANGNSVPDISVVPLNDAASISSATGIPSIVVPELATKMLCQRTTLPQLLPLPHPPP